MQSENLSWIGWKPWLKPVPDRITVQLLGPVDFVVHDISWQTKHFEHNEDISAIV